MENYLQISYDLTNFPSVDERDVCFYKAYILHHLIQYLLIYWRINLQQRCVKIIITDTGDKDNIFLANCIY